MSNKEFTYTIQDKVLLLEFLNHKNMSEILEDVSCFVEGKPTVTRIGHNFPVSKLIEYIKSYQAPKSSKCVNAKVKVIGTIALKHQCSYVIGYLRGDIHTKKHELQHAKYFVDASFRKQVNSLWLGLDSNVRDKVSAFLTKLGYPHDVIIDEFQAYYFTERRNFFGVHID